VGHLVKQHLVRDETIFPLLIAPCAPAQDTDFLDSCHYGILTTARLLLLDSRAMVTSSATASRVFFCSVAAVAVFRSTFDSSWFRPARCSALNAATVPRSTAATDGADS